MPSENFKNIIFYFQLPLLYVPYNNYNNFTLSIINSQ